MDFKYESNKDRSLEVLKSSITEDRDKLGNRLQVTGESKIFWEKN